MKATTIGRLSVDSPIFCTSTRLLALSNRAK